MLVISRKRDERILVKPDSRAIELAKLLRKLSDRVRDDQFVGDVQEMLAEALPLAEALASDDMAITLVRIHGLRAKLGIDAAVERSVVREELTRELKVPA